MNDDDRVPRLDDTFAPVVRLRRDRRYVYLLEWEQRPDGRWRARVVWVTRSPAGVWQAPEAWMPAEDLEPVEGQDYGRVPRRPAEPDF
ncbi:hypothetical protein [Actinoallomurus vinaceus]|uniref:hypothetical protein n=1 Tax=Actinoallomurus vinaceus TaxID=1080074 RepID=UPI0031EA7B30